MGRNNGKPQTIPAVPTTYGNVKYRSRLEARWAVFLDNVGLEYSYENFTDRDGDKLEVDSLWNWGDDEDAVRYWCAHYTPDFRIVDDGGDIIFIEVKPKEVTEEYLQNLRHIGGALALDAIPMFLAEGDFYNDNISIYAPPYKFTAMFLESLFGDCAAAKMEANRYRFDLQ